MKKYNSSHWQEIFRTKHGAVYQSDRERCFWLEFKQQQSAYGIQCFQKLKRQLTAIDLNEMAYNLSNEYDFQVLNTRQHSLKLNLCEIYQLKSLVDGAWVMLDLNRIINERLYFAQV